MSIDKFTTCLNFLIFFGFFVSCSPNEKQSEPTEKEVINWKFPESVKTEKAVLSDQETELTLTGKVEYDPEKVIHYVPLVHGMVERTYFSLGDKVQKGQTLMDIRSLELSALLSESISLESELAVEQRNLQSVQGMYDDKMLSEKALLEAQSKFRQVQTACERAKNDLSLYRHKDGGVFSILAPMSGYIVDKQVASGSPVSSEGNPLFTVADLSKVWITVNVYAGDLQHVQEGTPVKITALSYPNEMFDGKIDALSQVFDPEEKVLKARIVMPNVNLKFKPEMSVVIHLKNKAAGQQIAIPSDALIFDGNQYFVVVENTGKQFEAKEVTLNGHLDKTAYIHSGLSEGEKVVVKNQLLIYEGLKGE